MSRLSRQRGSRGVLRVSLYASHPRSTDAPRGSDDTVGEDVLDRTQVQLALTGAMLGDIADSQLIWRTCAEVALDDIVHRWPNLAVLAALLSEHAPPLVLGADPPCGAFDHRLAGVAGLFDQVAVAELGVLVVGVEQRVGPVGLEEFGVGDGIGRASGKRAGGRA